jgi:RHH-type proline utilization regulon transcriptional repressor/proline dehydrogenase/delta 1-pyrroline-5-carboxylate dehydrogenase
MLEQNHRDDELTEIAISNAKKLITSAKKSRRSRDKANRKRIARLFKDPGALEATITLTDEVMRISSPRAATRILRRAAAKASIRGFGFINSLGLRFIALLSGVFPRLILRIVHWRVRSYSKDLILDSRPEKLHRHIEKRKEMGISLNINVIGEAVLGHQEAEDRYQSIVEMIRRPEVGYISVKLSAIVAQLITIDVTGSRNRAVERLRELYRVANENCVFINLDMEEYRDLAMTVAAFKTVLDEDEFSRTNAGIVLQAYLPESHEVFDELVEWSKERFKKYKSHIKIRLVKGANLAMEQAESEIHGHSPAPYRSKADVDASYLRLVDVALSKENSKAVRIGIASHNLFHLSWSLALAEQRGVIEQLDIEMLEGMANAEALSLTKTGHPVLLYAPVTKPDDFAAAVAYLVRRLDENTSPENYLRAAFEIEGNKKVLGNQESRFRNALRDRYNISTNSLRHLNIDTGRNEKFVNQNEADPTDPKFLKELNAAIKRFKLVKDWEIPAVVAGKDFYDDIEGGVDPSDGERVWYHYGVGDKKLVETAIKTAKSAQTKWSSLSISERGKILRDAAKVMQDRQTETIAVMMRDAGKTAAEAIPEISEAIDFANFYSYSAKDFGPSTPLGTVLVVPPWNFPYAIPIGGVCAALAAGNTVILKPAPETVATAYEAASQLWDGGVPKEVLQFLPMRDDESGKYLVTHEGIDGVILTGSFETAKLFTSWRPEINLLAETSGKNATLISACADIDSAVKDLVQSAFGHAGQKCSASSVAIVESSVYRNPAFIRQLKDAVTSLKVGAGWQLSTSMGPIIRRPEQSLMRALTSLDQGESWLVEPRALDEGQLIWQPGVKIGVRAGSWSHLNEWFGPVLAVIEAPDFETAIRFQNETDYGLTAGIQSLDQLECETWIENIEAGNLYVNRGTTGAIVNRQPFGGWKRSSVGPNAKAGGWNYVNTLRIWPRVTEISSAKFGVDKWWSTIGANTIDHSNLKVEKNFHRYRRYSKPILVFVDETTSPSELELINYIINVTKVNALVTSDPKSLSGDFVKVRWLAAAIPPKKELLSRGISIDHRPVAQRGDIETPRWLLEQSVSITHHRYGNVNGGPKPRVSGL